MFVEHPPFAEMSPMRAILQIIRGHRPARPTMFQCRGSFMADGIWDLINVCWSQEPHKRLTMPAALTTLRNVVHALASAPATPDYSHDPILSAIPAYGGLRNQLGGGLFSEDDLELYGIETGFDVPYTMDREEYLHPNSLDLVDVSDIGTGEVSTPMDGMSPEDLEYEDAFAQENLEYAKSMWTHPLASMFSPRHRKATADAIDA
jgi:hypothetical protein